jgi:hypothetical protein
MINLRVKLQSTGIPYFLKKVSVEEVIIDPVESKVESSQAATIAIAAASAVTILAAPCISPTNAGQAIFRRGKSEVTDDESKGQQIALITMSFKVANSRSTGHYADDCPTFGSKKVRITGQISKVDFTVVQGSTTA